VTGAVGILLALVAGWTVSDRRRMAFVVVVPFLAVLVEQTWHIAAGYGVSSPETVNKFPELIGYYIVQVIILALALGAANLIRSRRMSASGSGRTPLDGRRQTRIALMINGAVSVVVVLAFLFERPVFDPGSVVHHSAQGHPPWPGFLGIGLSAAVCAVLGLLALKGRRSQRTQLSVGSGVRSEQRAA
jgi:hypothetical protein